MTKAAEHAEAVQSLVEKASEAVQNYEAVAKTRVRWLVQRIVSFAPHSDELQRFYFVYAKFSLASIACAAYNRAVDGYDEDTFEREWKGEERTRGDLTSAVERLASGMPPRRPSKLHQAGADLSDGRNGGRLSEARGRNWRNSRTG